jgi:hypothetical protein
MLHDLCRDVTPFSELASPRQPNKDLWESVSLPSPSDGVKDEAGQGSPRQRCEDRQTREGTQRKRPSVLANESPG